MTLGCRARFLPYLWVGFVLLGQGCLLAPATDDAEPLRDATAKPADAGSSGLAPATADTQERVETAVDEGLVAISIGSQVGDVETELRDTRSGALLVKAWFSRSDGRLAYSLLATEGEAAGKGEVLTTIVPVTLSLEDLNLTVANLWQASRTPRDPATTYEPYAPGCHIVNVPVTAPNEARNHCIQDCCAIFQSWDDVWDCDEVPGEPPYRGLPGSPLFNLPWTPCGAGQHLFATCIAKCALLPLPETYGNCQITGHHRCFDSCDGQGRMYCAENCYTDESPCDVKPSGTPNYCNYLDGAHHECPTGNLRQGYFATNCDTTISSCECRAQDLWRCMDARCAAGRAGYCADAIHDWDGTPKLPDDQVCDPKDTRSPCCGAANQTCCDGVCESGHQCSSFAVCTPCGREGQKPCSTPDGLRCEDHLDYRGTGNCQKCGGVAPAVNLCCSNSVQYRASGNDPCPYESPWFPGNNTTQCIGDRCVNCGHGDGPCCPEGIPKADGTYPGVPCRGEAPCRQNGTCVPCGEEGQICCPGGISFHETNYCQYDTLMCMSSGTCVPRPPEMPPPPGMPNLQITAVSPWVFCSRVDFEVTNMGDAPSSQFFAEVSMRTLSSDPLWSSLKPSLAPGESVSVFAGGLDGAVCNCALSGCHPESCNCTMHLIVRGEGAGNFDLRLLDDFPHCTPAVCN